MRPPDPITGEAPRCNEKFANGANNRLNYWSSACSDTPQKITSANAIGATLYSKRFASSAALSEEQIRTIVRQEIQASGADSSLKPLLEMTPDQAIVISTAIAFLWATAWCFKQVAKFLKEKDYEDS